MKRVYIICLAILLAGLMIKSRNTTVLYEGVAGHPCDYTRIERDLTLDDFKYITLDMTYEKITSEIGEPNGMVGNGIVWPYYQLNDGSCVILEFNKTLDRKREFTTLKNIRIADTAGREYILDTDRSASPQ